MTRRVLGPNTDWLVSSEKPRPLQNGSLTCLTDVPEDHFATGPKIRGSRDRCGAFGDLDKIGTICCIGNRVNSLFQ